MVFAIGIQAPSVPINRLYVPSANSPMFISGIVSRSKFEPFAKVPFKGL